MQQVCNDGATGSYQEIDLSFSVYCDRATHLTPPDSVMDHKSFKIEVLITKVQLE